MLGAAASGLLVGSLWVFARPATLAPFATAAASRSRVAGPPVERPDVEGTRLPAPARAAPVHGREPAATTGAASSGRALDVRVASPTGGEVELVLHRGSLEHGRGVTRDGVFRFERLAAGGYLLEVNGADGLHAALDPREARLDADGTWLHVDVPERAGTVSVDVELVRPAWLAGCVLAGDGTPVADATVICQDVVRGSPVVRVRTDGLGRFDAGRVRPSEYAIAAWSEETSGGRPLERLIAPPRERELQAGETAWLTLRAGSAGRSVRGRVVDRERAPVAGLDLVCWAGRTDARRPPAALVVARARTGTDGVFLLDDLPAVDVCVAVDGRELALRASGARRLERGFATQVLDLARSPDRIDLGVLKVAASDGPRVTPRASR